MVVAAGCAGGMDGDVLFGEVGGEAGECSACGASSLWSCNLRGAGAGSEVAPFEEVEAAAGVVVVVAAGVGVVAAGVGVGVGVEEAPEG